MGKSPEGEQRQQPLAALLLALSSPSRPSLRGKRKRYIPGLSFSPHRRGGARKRGLASTSEKWLIAAPIPYVDILPPSAIDYSNRKCGNVSNAVYI